MATIDNTLDKMQDMLPYMMEIIDDGDVKAKGKTVGETVRAMFPVLAVKHREALIAMMAVDKGVTAEEARKLPYAEMRRFLSSSIVDDMLDFFIFSLRLGRKL